MARQRFIYRKDKEGNVRAVKLNTVARHIPGEALDDFNTRMRKTLYQLECDKGTEFQVPGFTKDQLKHVWFDRAA